MTIVENATSRVVKFADMIDVAAFIAAREAAGLSQADLANRAGCSQQLIAAIEKMTTRTTKFAPQFARILQVPVSTIDKRFEEESNSPLTPSVIPSRGENDLPVHGAVQGGDGVLAISSDPVDWVRRPEPLTNVKDGYGVIIVGESMWPEFKPGDTALVHPHLPPIAGEACIFYAADPDGGERATIKSFLRATESVWHVEQWNPPRKFTLGRKEWGKCHRVVGKYGRR